MQAVALRPFAFVDVDHHVKQVVHSTPVLEHRGHERDAEQLAQLVVVELVAARLKFVKHIQRAHDFEVHVYELRCEVQVALKVACVDDVYYHVGRVFDNLLAHIQLFGAVCRQRVSAGQVYEVERVSAIFGLAFFRVNRNSGVIAHALVGARSEVEQRRLAAVGVAHECHVYRPAFLHRRLVQLLVGYEAFVVAVFFRHFRKS